MEQSTLTVEGMTCRNCASTVEKSVEKLDGVNHVKVDLDNGNVDVEYNPSSVNLSEIKSAIEDSGYEVAS